MIPNIKIFSYGYDANVDNVLSSAGQNTIHQNAQNLLSDLADLRNSPSQVGRVALRLSAFKPLIIEAARDTFNLRGS